MPPLGLQLLRSYANHSQRSSCLLRRTPLPLWMASHRKARDHSWPTFWIASSRPKRRPSPISSCRGAGSAVMEDLRSHASRVYNFWSLCWSSKTGGDGMACVILGRSTAKSVSQTTSSVSLVFRRYAMSISRLGNTCCGCKVIHLVQTKSPMD